MTKDTSQISLGDYMFRRLLDLGIRHVFGVPGDFNLHLLDHVYSVPEITWVGTCNELNGAYAADGYARIKGHPAALVTTFGVGELSAMNGIAGAYSEHVPIIHIVGMTSRIAQEERIMIHHTLDQGWDHTTFTRMSEPIRSTFAILTDERKAAKEIDRVCEAAYKIRRPVYLFVPMDMPDILIDASPLESPLDLVIRNSSEADENAATEALLEALYSSTKPSLVVDVLAHRYGLTKEVREFSKLTQLPVRSRSKINMETNAIDLHYTIVKVNNS